jgi:hypothetical protein
MSILELMSPSRVVVIAKSSKLATVSQHCADFVRGRWMDIRGTIVPAATIPTVTWSLARKIIDINS